MKTAHLTLYWTLTAIPGSAQNVTGNIVGTIKDAATGAAVAGAPVAIVNEGTNIEFKTQSNSDGDFVAPGLPGGTYTVRVEAPGFRATSAKA